MMFSRVSRQSVCTQPNGIPAGYHSLISCAQCGGVITLTLNKAQLALFEGSWLWQPGCSMPDEGLAEVPLPLAVVVLLKTSDRSVLS